MFGFDLALEILIIGLVMNIVFMVLTFMWLLPQIISYDKVRMATFILELEKLQAYRKTVYPKWDITLKQFSFMIPFFAAYLQFVNYLYTWSHRGPLVENIINREKEQIEAYKAKNSK